MGLMNERATDQMGCVHPWPVLVDLWCVCVCARQKKREVEIEVKRIIFFVHQKPFSPALTSGHHFALTSLQL